MCKTKSKHIFIRSTKNIIFSFMHKTLMWSGCFFRDFDCNHHTLYVYIIQIKNKFNLILMAIMQQHIPTIQQLYTSLYCLFLFVCLIYVIKFNSRSYILGHLVRKWNINKMAKNHINNWIYFLVLYFILLCMEIIEFLIIFACIGHWLNVFLCMYVYFCYEYYIWNYYNG